MITIRSKTLFLCACFIEALWLLAAQMLNATILLLPCLLCFLALVGWAALQNAALPVIFFFLPFAPLLKFRPGTISFFTIALLHTAVSSSKALITLGIGSAKAIKVADRVIKVLCVVTLIADITGFYLFVC